MSLTLEEKEKCAAIFEAVTDIHTEPHRWNEKAADYLAEMMDKLTECSRGMGIARSFLYPGVKVSWTMLVKIPYHIIKSEIKMRYGKRNVMCITIGVSAYDELIQMALME
ncbi:MAG: hypothetical protein GY874_08255 [Desulfobacteraceae bacterium]|nr:hypothetical protein [Desulfobacteraceae bacterium]